MKFELVSRCKGENELLPQRETKYSAGYDFKAAETVVVSGHDKPVLVKTGVKAKLNAGTVLLLADRSSNPVKRGLVLSNGLGVIDADYYNNESNEGEIMGMFYHFGPGSYTIHKGDRIMQGIIVPFFTAENDHAAGKRTGGIGSTGGK